MSKEEAEVLLRLDKRWKEPKGTSKMSVPKMLSHIYERRPCAALAPNGYTTPFITLEEWGRIGKWAAGEVKRARRANDDERSKR